MVLSKKKYEMIEQNKINILALTKKIFFTTDIDKNVTPVDKKE